ncbi:MAG: chromosomal replication initiator protein DnaA [Mariniblastus sp.]|nr:chromosomal replication initiator protein DnaA [Mariniblastus sp.]
MALSTQDRSPNGPKISDSRWSDLQRTLVKELGQSIFEMWFSDPGNIVISGNLVTIYGDSDFSVQRLSTKLSDSISKAVHYCCGPNIQIRYEKRNVSQNIKLNSPGDAGKTRILDSDATARDSEIHSGSQIKTTSDRSIRRRQGLESFWFGESNRLAEASTRQMFQQLGQLTPFLIYGPTGCGKTHLLESITSEARRKLKLKRCVFMSAEQFTTYFIGALRGTGLPSFRRKYRDLDLLAIDDIQFFAGKKATLGEFQFTIDNLVRNGKQVILSSDRPPIELNHFGNETVARFSAGLICPLQYPDLQGRRQIIARMCGQRQFNIPSSVRDLIAERLGRDVRRLSGAINRVHAVAEATNRPITVEMAKQVLIDLFSVTSSMTSLNTIEKAVCDFCEIKPAELRSSSRRKRISTARMLAMYLSRQYTSSAFSEIGDYFGGRSHSTVIAAQKKVNDWITENQAIDLPNAYYPAKEAIARLESNLRIG